MTRIIVIGSSHVAAFKTAWEKISVRHPDVSVDFFGATVPIFRKMRLGRDLVFGLDPKRIHAGDESWDLVEKINGATSIDLARPDIVVRVGYRTMDEAVLETLATHAVDGLREAPVGRRMSALCFQTILDALAGQSAPPPRWRRWKRPKFVIATRPTSSVSLLESDHDLTSRFRIHAHIAEHPDSVSEALSTFDDKVAAKLAAFDISYLRQPDETKTAQGFTKADCTQGSPRLTNGRQHRDEDYIHMNDRYGALCFEKLFRELRVDA